MLVAAAVCPHTPLLVPALAGAAQAELYELRSACHTAVAALRDTDPDLLVRALAGADGETLAALDPAVADRLWVGGRVALQVLSGAANGGEFTGRVLAETEPYGVGYFAGLWEPRPL